MMSVNVRQIVAMPSPSLLPGMLDIMVFKDVAQTGMLAASCTFVVAVFHDMLVLSVGC